MKTISENVKERPMKLSIYKIAIIGVMTAIICIMAPFSIPLPFTVVPISLTNLAIYFTVFVLGWKMGTISYLIYLLIGLIGVPVFSGFTSGFSKLAGPTGGYLIGFIFLVIISGWFIEKFPNKIPMYIIGMMLGNIVTYLFGTIWLANLTGNTFKQALAIGVLPFLLGDLLKIIAAVLIGTVLRKQILRSGFFYNR